MKIKPIDVKKKRKICNEFYSRYFSQKISHYFSALFINLKIGPNTITTLMILIGIPSSLLLLSSFWGFQLLGALGLILINVFDTVDGEVARFTNNTSKYGIYLDNLMQFIVDFCLFVVLSFRFYRDENYLVTVFVFLYLLFYLIDIFSKKVYLSLLDNGKKKMIEGDNSNILKFIINITSSNTFIYHSYWLIVLILYIDTEKSISKYIVVFYFSYLAFMQFIKFIYRQYLIKRIMLNAKD